MVEKKSSDILIVSGVCFLRAYAGTLHLARALRASGHAVRILVAATETEATEYATLDIPVTCLIRRNNSGFFRKWETLRQRCRVFFEILRSRKVIITENGYLLEAVIAKMIRRKLLVLGHYCQELHLAEEYPGIPRIRLLNRLAKLPDFVIDVEPGRARVRMERLGLSRMPMILRNTLDRGSIPRRAEPGLLAKLAGQSFPVGLPVLIHMGGVGREKPLERVIDAVAACEIPVYFLAFCTGPPEKLEELRAHAAKVLVAGRYAILGPRRRDELLTCAWEADLGVVDYSVAVENTQNQRYCAPTKLYEFMALGLAVVGSNNQSLRDIVESEEFGKCADDGSALALGAALNFVLSDPIGLSEMKARARDAFEMRHCYEALCLPTILKISRIMMNLPDADDSLVDVSAMH